MNNKKIVFRIPKTLWEEFQEFKEYKPRTKFVSDPNVYLIASNHVFDEQFSKFFYSLDCDFNCELENFFYTFRLFQYIAIIFSNNLKNLKHIVYNNFIQYLV